MRAAALMEEFAGMQVWRLGSYELVRPLGEGGMAQVYLARDIRLGREVAVKVLDAQLAARPGFRERFLREARVAAALDHPNIVPLYDFGDSDQYHYLVMPYVSGGSLQDELRRAPFSLGEVAKHGSQIADALDYAHQRGVVHRDVKPANMLIHADGRIMLSDFGLAKILDGTPRPAAPRGRPDAGTPEYMAPEQVEGNTDARSDIYALGVVLYLLLTGHLPFSGSTAQEVMEGHLYRLPEPPRLLNPSVTPAMQEVVLRALAKHPDDRYQRASELGAALMAALVAGDVEPLPFTGASTFSATPLPPITPQPPQAPQSQRSSPYRSGTTTPPWNPPQLDPRGAPLIPPSNARSAATQRGSSMVSAPMKSAPMRSGPFASRTSFGPATGGLRSPAFPMVPGVPMPHASIPQSPEQAAGLASRPQAQTNPFMPALPVMTSPERPSQRSTLASAVSARPAMTEDHLPHQQALWPWVVVALVIALALVILALVLLFQHGQSTTPHGVASHVVALLHRLVSDA